MLITESEIRRLIRQEIRRKYLINEGPLGSIVRSAARSMGAGPKTQLVVSAIEHIDAATSQIVNRPSIQNRFIVNNGARVLRFLGADSAAGAFSAIAAPALFFLFVYNAFMFLPNMIQKQIETLDTIEGFLKNFKDQKDNLSDTRGEEHAPIEYSDLSDISDPSFPKFGNVQWDRGTLIDFIASRMNTREGKALYMKLQNDGIIGKSFASKILKRRDGIRQEGFESMLTAMGNKINDSLATPEGQEDVIKFAKGFGWTPDQITPEKST